MNRKNFIIIMLVASILISTVCFWGCSQNETDDETVRQTNTEKEALNTETEQNTESNFPNTEKTTDAQEIAKDSETTVASETIEVSERTEATETTEVTEATEVTETTEASESSETSETSPKPNIELTYEAYNALSAEEQYAYCLSFASIEDFLAWYNQAKQEYEDAQNRTEIGDGGSIDIGEIFGN